MKLYKATTVGALASALAELSNVSNGSVASITFEGGYDCGWIAAVAEWLLCLKVKVLTEEGICLYWQDSSQNNDSAQVIIIFDTHTHHPNLAGTRDLKVVDRSFRLTSNGAVELFRRSGRDVGELFGMGRSNWSTILEDTFGSAFKLLLSPNIMESFVKVILSGAMAHESDDHEAHKGWKAIHPWMGPFSSPAASQERGFLLAIASRLPELSPLLAAVEHLKRSAGAAASSDEGQLRKFCACDDYFAYNRGNPSHRDICSRRDICSSRDICLRHLGTTLTNLILILAHIDIDETLQPASTGLLMLYDHVVEDSFLGSSSEVRERGDDIDNTLRRTFELFTGLPSHNSVHKLGAASAICHGSVCIWLPALENPLYDPFKQMGLRVFSGKVSFRGRLYREIVDMEDDNPTCTFDSIMPRIAAHGTSRVSTLIVRETFEASQLEAWIELRPGKTSSVLNTYVDQLGVERPRGLPSELRLHIRKLILARSTVLMKRGCDQRSYLMYWEPRFWA